MAENLIKISELDPIPALFDNAEFAVAWEGVTWKCNAEQVKAATVAEDKNRVVLTGSTTSKSYTIPTDYLVEKVLIKSTSDMAYTVSNTPGANDINTGESTAGTPNVFNTDLFADGLPRTIYFENLLGSWKIIIYLR